jgi:hypothetical protein
VSVNVEVMALTLRPGAVATSGSDHDAPVSRGSQGDRSVLSVLAPTVNHAWGA